MKRFALVAILFSMMSLAASESITLEGLTMGNHVMGPNLSLADMKGKVVLVEFWGTKCGPCLALMPRVADIYKKYADQGLHVIGIEAQQSSEADIKSKAKPRGATYQICAGGNLKGTNFSGIPHGFLFGVDGKLAVDNPHGAAEIEKKVKELLKDVNAAMAGEGPYTKLAGLQAQVKAGVGLGSVLKQVEDKKASKDAAEAAEANMMFEALNSAATRQMAEAMKEKSTDPAATLTKLQKVAVTFAGSSIATKIKTEVDGMQKDPAVKKEIEAGTMLKQMAKIEDGLKPVKGEKDPASADFRKVNATQIASLVGGCQALTKNYAGTNAAKQAEEMLNQYK